jgi:hypothetical protein
MLPSGQPGHFATLKPTLATSTLHYKRSRSHQISGRDKENIFLERPGPGKDRTLVVELHAVTTTP